MTGKLRTFILFCKLDI